MFKAQRTRLHLHLRRLAIDILHEAWTSSVRGKLHESPC